MLIMKDINKFIQNHNTLTLATERNHEVFAAALFYVPVNYCKALIFVIIMERKEGTAPSFVIW